MNNNNNNAEERSHWRRIYYVDVYAVVSDNWSLFFFCRYTKDREGRLKRHKFIYLVWLPEDAPPPQRRRYQLVGQRYRALFSTDIHFDWYATTKEELNLNDLTARCRKMA